ncbi:hypothetical protein [Vibrio parahaemolyticus]|uniref:hypothetical protein n=1 Tax=Vibrio parahaemolyticus TaxID=670 RepID=UPI00111F4B52|nr:hypothetical protein [Vibrio parahaemolyticus]TOG38877.1 hypothetical protein CGJ02_22770 [Vibrio parahaemolyticus]
MKKLVLLLPALLLSNVSMAKVTYEDALESSQAYYDANAAVHHPPAERGLTDAELQDGSGGNQMGKWVKVSSTAIATTNGGSYSNILNPDSEGATCIKGEKGLILATRVHTFPCYGGINCATEVQFTGDGYKAECK